MNSITQEARLRQQAVEYSLKNTVTETELRFKVSRMTIYRWRKRYNGTWKSLEEKSHRPKHCPKEQTKEEYELIKKHYPYYNDMIILWNRIKEKGYKRCYQTMLRAIKRMKLAKEEKKKRTRKPKPYQKAYYPGQKVQVDVKYVPRECVSDGQKILSIYSSR